MTVIRPVALIETYYGLNDGLRYILMKKIENAIHALAKFV